MPPSPSTPSTRYPATIVPLSSKARGILARCPGLARRNAAAVARPVRQAQAAPCEVSLRLGGRRQPLMMTPPPPPPPPPPEPEPLPDDPELPLELELPLEPELDPLLELEPPLEELEP